MSLTKGQYAAKEFGIADEADVFTQATGTRWQNRPRTPKWPHIRLLYVLIFRTSCRDPPFGELWVARQCPRFESRFSITPAYFTDALYMR